MPNLLKVPVHTNLNLDVHTKWLNLLKLAENVSAEDDEVLATAATGLYIQERHVPPEILGRFYAQYCTLINKMYDVYLNNVQIQRAPYILQIINVLTKRMYEIRQELVNFIINDYIYVDLPLAQLLMTPFDIEIVVPYHFPREARSDSMEQLLESMCADAVKRKDAPLVKKSISVCMQTEEWLSNTRIPSINHVMCVGEVAADIVITEADIQANIIQKHERCRQWFLRDFKEKCATRKLYFAKEVVEVRIELKTLAAKLIQRVSRKFMEIKRVRDKVVKRDMLIGVIPDPDKERLNFMEENNKVYDKRRQKRESILKTYLEDREIEITRLILYKKDGQIDDVTDHIRDWLREWFYGYKFFPEYPYVIEGGTILVIRGDYPTIDEQIADDERYAAATKGKTKEQLRAIKKQAKADAALQAALAKEKEKKLAIQVFKARCNPTSDPGYLLKQSPCMRELIETLQKYRASWSLNDTIPDDTVADRVYGYIKLILKEDLMNEMHIDCRKYVDELMRLEQKLLVKAHQAMYQLIGEKLPKMRTRPKPKAPRVPKRIVVGDALIKQMEPVFDLDIVSKPTSKLEDIWGELNIIAYDFNVKDPDVKFPPPCYGDVKSRLLLSCIFGSGVAPGAKKNKSVMLLGPERNGKSFLVDCVAGELNAVKIDISPKVFSAICDKPAKVMTQVLTVAKAFQPTIIYLRNVEKVYANKVPPEDKYLNATSMKAPLQKLLKSITVEDKIILIATCSIPFSVQAKAMTSLFDETILVPLADYRSLQMYFYNKLQSIRSMPRDYCTQAIAQLLQGYGSGVITGVYDKVMTPERIIRLNITPLSPVEFLDAALDSGSQPVTTEEYTKYVEFFLDNSPLKTAREQYKIINFCRADVYAKMAKKAAADEAKKSKSRVL